VDAVDGGDEGAHKLAGVREVQEEAGVVLPDPAGLLPWARWITPRQVAVRFDTHFFLARAPAGAEPRVDGAECVDWGWYAPADALARGERGDLLLAFPTIKVLEGLAQFASAEALLEWARGRRVEPIEPKVVMEGEVAKILLPDDPGYDA
jgi:8-oxo-dGTP pyrophosphatase MutT (NUDIX family)